VEEHAYWFCPEVENERQSLTGSQLAQATFNTSLSFVLTHAAGVNSLIWVILADGRRVNKILQVIERVEAMRRQLPSSV